MRRLHNGDAGPSLRKDKDSDHFDELGCIQSALPYSPAPRLISPRKSAS